MKKSALLLAFVAGVGAGGYLTYVIGQPTQANLDPKLPPATPNPADLALPIHEVESAEILLRSLPRVVSGFGQVVPGVGGVERDSLAFDARLVALHVTVGDVVSEGQILAELGPSQAARAQLTSAEQELLLASALADGVRQQHALGLLTAQTLTEAEGIEEAARIRHDALVTAGAGKTTTLHAHFDGIVLAIPPAIGDLLPAGGVVIEIAARGGQEIRLGVEATKISQVQVGQEVRLDSLANPAATSIPAQVVAITQSLNPDTRLFDVRVKPLSSDGIHLGEFLSGSIVVEVTEHLSIPRQSLVPSGLGWVFFTVQDGRAQRHEVPPPIASGSFVAIDGLDLPAGTEVVIRGQGGLAEGSLVRSVPAVERP